MILPRELVKQHLLKLKNPVARDPVADAELKRRIAARFKAERAVLVAHYYTSPEVQALAEESGGCVADSLEMARFGREHEAQTLVVAGVRFMGETAKILNPEKRVLMPTLEAECSLDLGCPPEEFAAFCDAHPGREVVVYANTSAAVKARADWVVTSSIAYPLVEHLARQGKRVLWAPDKHLGAYVRKVTKADMVLWDGACVVHEEFKADGIEELLKKHPGAAVLAHPESPAAVLELADVVGSTSQLIAAAGRLENAVLIVATERGIFYRMGKEAPGKVLIAAPTGGAGATCQSCARCPWMAMNELESLVGVFERGGNEVVVPGGVGAAALVPLERMLEFGAGLARRGGL